MTDVSRKIILRRFQDIVEKEHAAIIRLSYLPKEKLRNVDRLLSDMNKNATLIIERILASTGLVLTEEATRRARAEAEHMYSDKDKRKMFVAFFRKRYDLLRRGNNVTLPEPEENKLADVLGKLHVMRVEPATKPDEGNRIHVRKLKEMARNVIKIDQHDYENQIPNFLVKMVSKNPLPRSMGSPWQPVSAHIAMCPTLVALFTRYTPVLYRRFIHADLARAVSNQFRGKNMLPVDLKLYNDITTLQDNGFFSSNPFEDLVERSRVQQALRNEIFMLRGGNLNHSSQRFYTLLNRCEMKREILNRNPQVNMYKSPVKVVRSLFDALNFKPTILQRLPRHLNPVAPIPPTGFSERVPIVQTFLPPIGMDYPRMQTSKKMYPLITKCRGIGWNVDKFGRVFQDVAYVQTSPTYPILICHVPREGPEIRLPSSMPQIPDDPKRLLVNDTHVDVPYVLGPRKGKGYVSAEIKHGHADNLDLVSVVCADVDKDRVLKGYYCYVKHIGYWVKYHPAHALREKTYFVKVTKISQMQHEWRTHGILFMYTRKH